MMTNPSNKRCLRAIAGGLMVTMFAPGLALAALGQGGSSVESDRAQLQAQRNITQSNGYSVHELTLPGGTQVREYLSPSQQIFAVAWNGPSIPDLQQLLGAYFPRYQSAAARAARGLRRPVVLQEPDLVIQSGGHARAFSGAAYLPQKMPSGVGAEQIR